MSDTHQPITFEAPPVNEVALAVQLNRPVVDLEVLGGFAGEVKGSFPHQETQPAPPRMDEPDRLTMPQVQLAFGAQNRTWFVSEDGHQLIQLQSDRLVVNWRRLAGDQPYPRYVALRQLLKDQLESLADLLDSTGKGSVAADFCEATYINEVVVPGTGSGDRHPPLDSVIAGIQPGNGAFLREPKDAQLQVRWRIPPNQLPGGCAIGRLYTAISPAFRPDTQLPLYAMNMTARIGCPGGIDFPAALDALDVAHDWIVRGFADLTTDAMHSEWRLQS